MRIETDEGQALLKQQHGTAMCELSHYPALCRHMSCPAEEFLADVLRSSGEDSEVKYPALYFWAMKAGEASHYRTRLRLAERGLDLVCDKATKANRTDLIGNLCKVGSGAAVFECVLFGALVAEFEDSSVTPYARIRSAGRATCDCAVEVGCNRLLIEATALFEDEPSRRENERTLRAGRLVSDPTLSIPEEQARLGRKLADKAARPYAYPVLICLNQACLWPEKDHVVKAISDFLAYEAGKTASKVAGVAYLRYYQLIDLYPGMCGTGDDLVGSGMDARLRAALKRFTP